MSVENKEINAENEKNTEVVEIKEAISPSLAAEALEAEYEETIENKPFLTYEDFGAVGDGEADDFPAIIACHAEANRLAKPVKVKEGAVYYISGMNNTAIIKTNTDFSNAKFVIDDRELENKSSWVFSVEEDRPSFELTVTSLEKNQKTVTIPHLGNIYVKVQNENRRMFVRNGMHMENGFPTRDCFTVDENGNVLSPIDWDYPEITGAYAKSIDDTPITICGGIFTTVANESPAIYNYHARGIKITRSNVTVENVTHLIENEGENGAPYLGFINISETANVKVKNCKLTAHTTYYTESTVEGKLVPMESFDLSVSNSVGVKIVNLSQTNDIFDKSKSGIFHSNFCKNLVLDGCTLSRIDSHEGVSNITVKNCKVGHKGISLFGFGEALIENTESYGAAFISLRGDYGSHWDGNITVKNCTWTPATQNMRVLGAWNKGMHDFGYECSMPRSLSISGLKVNDTEFDLPVYIFGMYDDEYTDNKPFPYAPCEILAIRDVELASGKDYQIIQKPKLLGDIQIVKDHFTYEDFGAKGDGVTDDMPAIIACHDAANKVGFPVKAKDGAVYYISPEIRSATIKTSVDFGTATFIIDDVGVDLEKRGTSLFRIVADTNYKPFTIDSLKKNQTHLDFPHEGTAFIKVQNDNKKIFIREGLNMNSGKSTVDNFVVDASGKVLCPIDWDYDEFTLCQYKSADDTPITISGGTFKTIANQAESFYNYHGRNFNVTRCNVTIKGVTHLVEGELDHGAPYAGFFNISDTYNVLVEDCLLTPHFIYYTESKVPGKPVAMGSYDINVNNSVKATLRRITQTVDIMDKRYGGLIHTNFCKNLLVEDCVMSRYDAHEGVSNITIRGCTLGHQCLNLIGFGDALIENTRGYGNAFIVLRPDYGSFWHGNITIKNCVWQPSGNGMNHVIYAKHNGTHDFGYPCSMPTRLTINGFKVLNGAFEDKAVRIVTPYCDPTAERTYDYGTIKVLTVKDFVTESGEGYNVCTVPELLPDIKVNDGVLHYEDFGAVGDGVTDDFAAIIACHDLANKAGLPVKAKDGATYYIGGKNASAVIKTDVDFGTAKFIIDDTVLENIKAHVFKVESDFEPFSPDIKMLLKGQKKLMIGNENDLYIRVFNSNSPKFIRKGLNMNNGNPTTDCFLLDKEGNITPSIDWDYPEITKTYAIRSDDKPITISGGIFTTVANRAESFYNYHARGFSIKRSNTTVKGLTHYVEGEIDHGAPYGGFLNVTECANVNVVDCLLTAHLIYWTESKVPGKPVAMGSYDINFGSVVNGNCKNVTQTTDIMDKRYWGIYTSNFSKNLTLENCVLSRFDAHQGVTNVTIKGCKLGHQCMNLIGFGEAIIEDTEAYGHNFISLRSDYGSIWNGNVTIRNCSWNPAGDKMQVIGAYNTGDHDFGYTCCMPANVSIDGLTVHNSDKKNPVYLLANYDSEFEKDKPYAYVTTKELTYKNIVSENDIEPKICESYAQYEGLEITKY